MWEYYPRVQSDKQGGWFHMWECPYCGTSAGHLFQDGQLHGILCLNSECGRVDVIEDTEDYRGYEWSDF